MLFYFQSHLDIDNVIIRKLLGTPMKKTSWFCLARPSIRVIIIKMLILDFYHYLWGHLSVCLWPFLLTSRYTPSVTPVFFWHVAFLTLFFFKTLYTHEKINFASCGGERGATAPLSPEAVSMFYNGYYTLYMYPFVVFWIDLPLTLYQRFIVHCTT